MEDGLDTVWKMQAVPRSKLQLVTVACMLIAAKQEEVRFRLQTRRYMPNFG